MKTIIEAIKGLCSTVSVESLSYHYSFIALSIEGAAQLGSMLDKIYDHNLVRIAQASYEAYSAAKGSDKEALAEIVLCLSSIKDSSGESIEHSLIRSYYDRCRTLS